MLGKLIGLALALILVGLLVAVLAIAGIIAIAGLEFLGGVLLIIGIVLAVGYFIGRGREHTERAQNRCELIECNGLGGIFPSQGERFIQECLAYDPYGQELEVAMTEIGCMVQGEIELE